MNIQSHVLGEFVALLATKENVETLSDDDVGSILNQACAKYRFRPSFREAKRICKKAAEEIKKRRRARSS